MNILRLLLIKYFLFVFFKFNFLIAAEPLPFNNIVLHKNPLQVSQVKLKDFYLKDIELNKNDGKIKILNFWATWCSPCKKEMLTLDNLSVKYPHIPVFPVNVDKPNQKKTKKFFDDINIKSLSIYFDPESKLANQFELIGIPTTILLDKEGSEFARIIGEIDFYDKKFVEWLKQFM